MHNTNGWNCAIFKVFHYYVILNGTVSTMHNYMKIFVNNFIIPFLFFYDYLNNPKFEKEHLWVSFEFGMSNGRAPSTVATIKFGHNAIMLLQCFVDCTGQTSTI